MKNQKNHEKRKLNKETFTDDGNRFFPVLGEWQEFITEPEGSSRFKNYSEFVSDLLESKELKRTVNEIDSVKLKRILLGFEVGFKSRSSEISHEKNPSRNVFKKSTDRDLVKLISALEVNGRIHGHHSDIIDEAILNIKIKRHFFYGYKFSTNERKEIKIANADPDWSDWYKTLANVPTKDLLEYEDAYFNRHFPPDNKEKIKILDEDQFSNSLLDLQIKRVSSFYKDRFPKQSLNVSSKIVAKIINAVFQYKYSYLLNLTEKNIKDAVDRPSIKGKPKTKNQDGEIKLSPGRRDSF